MFVVEKMNELANECIQKRAKFCKYNSLIYFERSDYFFSKYIGKPGNLDICEQKLVEKAKEITKNNQVNINEINSGAILLLDECLKSGKLIKSNNTLLTKGLYGLKYDNNESIERYQIILSNYEKLLSEFMSGKKSIPNEQKKKVAICIANIINLNVNFLGNFNYQRYIELGEECRVFANEEDSGIDKNEEWYKDFEEMMKDIEEKYEIFKKEEEMGKVIKKKYRKNFDEIDSKFTKKKK